MYDPNANREWHLGDSSAGRRWPTGRCGWSAWAACRRTAAHSCSGSTVIRRACSGRAGSARPDVASKSIASAAYDTSPSRQRSMEAHGTRSAASCWPHFHPRGKPGANRSCGPRSGRGSGPTSSCHGYVRPRPGRGMSGKRSPMWPLSDAACTALMRAMSTDNANPNNLSGSRGAAFPHPPPPPTFFARSGKVRQRTPPLTPPRLRHQSDTGRGRDGHSGSAATSRAGASTPGRVERGAEALSAGTISCSRPHLGGRDALSLHVVVDAPFSQAVLMKSHVSRHGRNPGCPGAQGIANQAHWNTFLLTLPSVRQYICRASCRVTGAAQGVLTPRADLVRYTKM